MTYLRISSKSENRPDFDLKAESLKSICYAVVYIKRQVDADIVKKICRRYLPIQSILVFVLADVCREDLLVEIESISVMESIMEEAHDWS